MTHKLVLSEKNQLDLDQYIPAMVTFLANKLSSGSSACYRKNFDVGVVEWRLLAVLKIEENITANRVCQLIGLDKAAVSRALKLLHARNYVTFTKDKKDARSSIIGLTPCGIKLHDRILLVALERETQLVDVLQPREIDTLIRLLKKLNARIEQVNSFEVNVE